MLRHLRQRPLLPIQGGWRVPEDLSHELVFLPPYAPNLNLIEQLWKFFKKKTLYNRYYETFADFKAACEAFFADPAQYRGELRSLLAENFEIVG